MFIDLNATLHQPGSEERNATRPLASRYFHRTEPESGRRFRCNSHPTPNELRTEAPFYET